MNWLKSYLFAFSPATFLNWTTEWTGLFHDTFLVHPHWQDSASLTASTSATLFSAAASAIYMRVSYSIIIAAWIFALLFISSLILLLYFRYETVNRTDLVNIEFFKSLWSYAFILTIVSFTQFIVAMTALHVFDSQRSD